MADAAAKSVIERETDKRNRYPRAKVLQSSVLVVIKKPDKYFVVVLEEKRLMNTSLR